MKKGYTLIDVLIIVVILGVLVTVAIPAYRRIIRRAELREVRNLLELTRAGARYYHLKYDITDIDTSEGQDAVFRSLRVDIPADSNCIYQIVAIGTTRQLQVIRRSDSALLYTYDLPDAGGSIQKTSDERYLQDLPNP